MVKDGEFEVTRKRRVLVRTKANVNYGSLIGTNPVKSYSSVSIKQAHPVKPIRLAFIGKGQIFGEEDFVNGRNYTTTVKCCSNTATVFMIKSCEFSKNFQKDSVTWDIILKNVRAKDNHTVMKIQSIATRNYTECKQSEKKLPAIQKTRETVVPQHLPRISSQLSTYSMSQYQPTELTNQPSMPNMNSFG